MPSPLFLVSKKKLVFPTTITFQGTGRIGDPMSNRILLHGQRYKKQVAILTITT